jgi:transcription antitermination factor NusG
MPFWVARIDQRRQALALNCLKLNAYEFYLPLMAARRGGDPEPLFRSYLFIAVAARGWWGARWSPGIVSLVRGAGEEPAQLADAVVAELRGREGRDGLIRISKRKPLNGGARFASGDMVRVGNGPLSGLVGSIIGLKPHERVAVLLELLGGSRPVELPVSAVERV